MRKLYKLYLAVTECIDYDHSLIQTKAADLMSKADSSLDYINRAYEFVRDDISHSWDVGATVVSRKASEVLRNKTGICWTKACLLAALLRANEIPSGISYQLLTRADEDDSEGYIIHALNTVYIEELDKWIRLDARGNKDNIQAQFSLDEEILAFPIRSALGEIDYKDNNPDLDERLQRILSNSRNILEITTSFEIQARGRKPYD